MSSLADQILFGTLEGVRACILAGEEIEDIDEYGFTPLIEAAIANKPDFVRVLLKEYKADSNHADVTGRTALHWAADNGNLEICRLLLEHGANPNAYTIGGQPALMYPLLRQQPQLRRLLQEYGASLNFAKDFINTKLLGHRYELVGEVDIVNAEGHFIPLSYEGFYLAFSLNAIADSLRRYCNHFSVRPLRSYLNQLKKVLHAFQVASKLLTYQNYLLDINHYSTPVETLFQQKPLLLPLAYAGHAISLIKYQDWIVYCDRGENRHRDGTVVVYRIQAPERWTFSFVKDLLYQRHEARFFVQTIYSLLRLVPYERLDIDAQLIGNCSWANIEAGIPAILFLLQSRDEMSRHSIAFNHHQEIALMCYQRWLAWDKERALEECIKDFYYADSARKATKAAILGAILFQKCHHNKLKDLSKAADILKILTIPDYQYVLKSYIKVFWHDRRTAEGENLVQLLYNHGVQFSQ